MYITKVYKHRVFYSENGSWEIETTNTLREAWQRGVYYDIIYWKSMEISFRLRVSN